jgi:peptidoglycan-associated lipoprotein
MVAVAGCGKKPKHVPASETAPTATAAAPTAQFTATPAQVSAGDQVQLSWHTTDATTVSIDDIGDVPTSGVKTVTPSASTTYHLVAKGDGGTAEATARVTVNAPPAVEVPTTTMSAEEAFKANVQDIFFDYDAYDIRGDAQATLSRDASYLASHPNVKIVIGGYCDERECLGHGRSGNQPHPRGQLRQREALLLRVYRGVLATEPPRRIHAGPVELQ